jgi:hypothetical protein
MDSAKAKPNMRERLTKTLKGEKPDRLAFVARMELWYSAHSRAGTLPEEFMKVSEDPEPSVISTFCVPIRKDFKGARLTEVHRAVGMGQQLQTICHGRKLNGVELIMKLNDEKYYHEKDPVIDYFPRLFNNMIGDQPGEIVAEFITPLGTLTTRSMLTEEMIAAGGIPIMQEYPVKGDDEFPAVEYIFEHAEFVPRFDSLMQMQTKMGDIGFVTPFLDRIPFQQVVLDLLGEVPCFYAIYENPALVQKLMAVTDQVILEDIRQVAAFDYPYIQFDDNLDGMITNPKLFPEFCLPYYQRYTELLHRQGKKVGSHTDGNLKRLLQFLPETGLDVCESFSPSPLTECRFDDAWAAFAEKGPMIWGGIPSPLLQADTGEEKLHAYIEHVLQTVGNRPILLGVSDLVTSDNLIERVRYIAEAVESHVIPN